MDIQLRRGYGGQDCPPFLFLNPAACALSPTREKLDWLEQIFSISAHNLI